MNRRAAIASILSAPLTSSASVNESILDKQVAELNPQAGPYLIVVRIDPSRALSEGEKERLRTHIDSICDRLKEFGVDAIGTYVQGGELDVIPLGDSGASG
jgi:hypothetical protein